MATISTYVSLIYLAKGGMTSKITNVKNNWCDGFKNLNNKLFLMLNMDLLFKQITYIIVHSFEYVTGEMYKLKQMS